MPQVSINAYVISVDIRKSKTLLVEGGSDKRVVQRIAANDPRCSTGGFSVDTAEFIKLPIDPDRSDIGNKTKVLETLSKLEGNEKFAILVDREWEGLRGEETGWKEFALPVMSDRKMVTSGHSIENYSFEPDFFSKAVLSRCYEHFNAEDENLIHACFSRCLLMALAVSQVISDAKLISRSAGIFRPSDFSWLTGDELRFEKDSGIQGRMADRKITNPAEILVRVQPTYQDLLDNFDCEPVKLYLHGHIGEEVVRALIASKVISMGIPEISASAFFTEGKEAREERLREYYSQLEDLPTSLAAVIDFLAA